MTARPINYTHLEKVASVGLFDVSITYRPHDPPAERWSWSAGSPAEYENGARTRDGTLLYGCAASEDGARRAVRKALVKYAIDALWSGRVR